MFAVTAINNAFANFTAQNTSFHFRSSASAMNFLWPGDFLNGLGSFDQDCTFHPPILQYLKQDLFGEVGS